MTGDIHNLTLIKVQQVFLSGFINYLITSSAATRKHTLKFPWVNLCLESTRARATVCRGQTVVYSHASSRIPSLIRE